MISSALSLLFFWNKALIFDRLLFSCSSDWFFLNELSSGFTEPSVIFNLLAPPSGFFRYYTFDLQNLHLVLCVSF